MFHTNVYSTALDTLLRNSSVSILVVYGGRDIFTSKAKYEAWSDSLRKTDDLSAQLEIALVPEADHFWSGSARTMLKRTLEEWLSQTGCCYQRVCL